MSRGYNHGKKPWSKLQKQLYNLFVPKLGIQMHCTTYAFSTKYDTFESPRHWITLDKTVIWDFPGPFLVWKHPDAEKSVQYLDEHYLPVGGGSTISNLIRDYIDTPKDELLTTNFDTDHWGLINIFRAADRRIGKLALRQFSVSIRFDEPAAKVLQKRIR